MTWGPMASGERFGKYTLINKIADGGMAEVFLAVVESLGGFQKRVALKKILPSFSRDESFVHSFVNEARICGQLHHPNVVQVYGFDRIDDYLCLAMEFIEGLDLERIITHRLLQRKLISPSIAAEIVLQMLDGLEYAHTATSMDNEPLNVVHRDLKPSNILIDRSGIIKIVDFGVAKASTNLYKTMNVGTAKGTVSYMSPEQASGRLDLGPASDVFGVGSILYELLTLRRLFDGENLFMILDEVRSAPLDEYFARIPREVPEGLVKVLRTALERDLSRRYSSAAAMARDIRAVFPDLQGPALLAAFVEELCADGMKISGLAEDGATGSEGGDGFPPETREDFPVGGEGGELGSFDLARLGISTPGRPPSVPAIPSPPVTAPTAGGAVRREDLATVPSETGHARPARKPSPVPRQPSPASVLRSSAFESPGGIGEDEATPVSGRRGRASAPEPTRPPWPDDEVTPVTRDRVRRPVSPGGEPRPALDAPPVVTSPPLPETGDSLAGRETDPVGESVPPGRRPGVGAPVFPAVQALVREAEEATGRAVHHSASEEDGTGASSVEIPAAVDTETRETGDDGEHEAGTSAREEETGGEAWQSLETKILPRSPDGPIHDAVDWLYSQPGLEVPGTGSSVERLDTLPEPLPNAGVESLLERDPSWDEGVTDRPFGVPLEPVAPDWRAERERVRKARLKRLRAVRYAATFVAMICVAGAAWTYFDMKPSVQELLFPSAPTRITVVVEDPPTWGRLVFVGDPEVVEVRPGVFRVSLPGKAAYDLKVVGPSYDSLETYRVVIDPEDPATWRIRRRFTRGIR